MRLYLRGISLANLYDNVLLPVLKSVGEDLSSNDLSRGQAEIIRINIETATDYFFPEMVSKSNNGKLALCASPTRSERFIVNATARILEVEGWEVLNLGDAIPFQTMANIVEQEPVNLVCVFWGETSTKFTTADIEPLKLAVQSYRLPFVRIGSPSLLREEAGSVDRFTFPDLQSLRNFLKTAARS
jgi:methanogenic corrinoid protein MtbC1